MVSFIVRHAQVHIDRKIWSRLAGVWAHTSLILILLISCSQPVMIEVVGVVSPISRYAQWPYYGVTEPLYKIHHLSRIVHPRTRFGQVDHRFITNDESVIDVSEMWLVMGTVWCLMDISGGIVGQVCSEGRYCSVGLFPIMGHCCTTLFYNYPASKPHLLDYLFTHCATCCMLLVGVLMIQRAYNFFTL